GYTVLVMSIRSNTPSTVTTTSLRNRPVLRLVLRGVWFLVVAYIVYLIGVGVDGYVSRLSSNAGMLQRITSIGFNLLSFSTIDVGSDLYIYLGYFALAVIIFIQRSDDWFAIFLSLMILTFGARVTSIASELSNSAMSAYWVSPIVMMGEAGIVLLGWLYPDGSFYPKWLRYIVPIFLLNVILFYWPGSPLYIGKLHYVVYAIGSLFWYLFSGASLVQRYRHTLNPNQKQQIRWVFAGMMGPLLWFVLFNIPSLFFPSLRDDTSVTYLTFQIIMRLVGIVLFLVLPASIAIAIARYKLFDIDLLINRAIVYGALSVALAAVFGLVLVVITSLINLFANGQDHSIGLMLSALAAGALFQPTRKALQRNVDRLIYNIHIDYLKTPGNFKGGHHTDVTAQAPALFSQYENLALIGKGGMAEVYRAEHPTNHTPVAIKVLLANLAEEEQYLLRFQRESRILAGLQHGNIVRLYDFGEENGIYYMVMEYLNGMNLSAFLRRRGQVKLDELQPILRDVSSALDYAHTSGLVHRDVKPSNVMLDGKDDASRRAVLTDFGIVKVSTSLSNITATGMVGTFDYIAPEQIQALKEIDGRADIYALGVMTYQLLTGVLPFHRNSPGSVLLAHMTTPPPDARDILPSLSHRSAKAIQKAMAKNPDERFATAAEFLEAVV
ncbi:MAG TPA: serine/threonine-protein kinase, partial [Anaerolineales bacterium]|nr:serine/threonine-protein kinase [Anaerolineales bacterium]